MPEKKARIEDGPVTMHYAMIGDSFEIYHKKPEIVERAAKALGRKPTEDSRGNKVIDLSRETFERAKSLLAGKGFILLPMP